MGGVSQHGGLSAHRVYRGHPVLGRVLLRGERALLPRVPALRRAEARIAGARSLREVSSAMRGVLQWVSHGSPQFLPGGRIGSIAIFCCQL